MAGCAAEYEPPIDVEWLPHVAILSPEDREVFGDHDIVDLMALVSDGNGIEDIQAVRWRSSLDGDLGTTTDSHPDAQGYSQLAVILSPGTHALTVEATELAGNTAEAGVGVEIVAEPQEPSAEILSPAASSEYLAGVPVNFTGSVTDPNQSLETLSVTWSAVLVGTGEGVPFASGSPTPLGSTNATWAATDIGDHVITLTVEDQNGNTDAAEIFVSILDPANADQDLDGATPAEGDCDDLDGTAYPSAPETCNAIDDNCNGTVDDKDDDGDLHVDVQCLFAYDGVGVADDCDDTRSDVHPGAAELEDAADQDCDSVVDEGTDAYDADGDCFCVGPLCSASANALCAALGTGDCEDTDSARFPGAIEIVADAIDQDCDSVDACYVDADDDTYGSAVMSPGASLDCVSAIGFASAPGDCDDTSALLTPADPDGDGASSCAGDCDETNPARHPGAAEGIADGIDQDCDGVDDCYVDADDDGFGTSSVVPGSSLDCISAGGFADRLGDCDDSSPALTPVDGDGDGLSSCAGDCDDTSPARQPGATELVADGIDQDCDGVDDCYVDVDDDEYGTSTVVAGTSLDCPSAAGLANASGDCDDASPNRHPGAPEVAGDGFDQDCDAVDLCYVDGDNDGFGSPALLTGPSLDCVAALGVAAVSGDCDDTAAAFHPGAVEIAADAVDQDCDGVDLCYLDADDDQHGVPTSVAGPGLDCDAPALMSSVADDCDDLDPTSNPDAMEVVADGIDQDCDGQETCFVDDDDDEFGVATTIAVSGLDCTGPVGISAVDGDCDDTDPSRSPLASEGVADGVDQDCDGAEDCYVDGDLDGVGGTATATATGFDCSLEVGFSPTSDDCDDSRADTYPGATEVPGDLVDQDCDGLIDCTDLDCDGTADLVFTIQAAGVVYEVDSLLYDYTSGVLVEGLPTMGAQASAVGDLDRDGFVDVAVANSIDNLGYNDIDSFVYWGSAAGHSASNRLGLPTRTAYDVLMADLDGNGWVDLVFANTANDNDAASELDSYVYWNLGTSPWFSIDARTSLPTWGGRGVAAGDLDDDGAVDLVFANSQARTRIYWGATEGYSAADFVELDISFGYTVSVADADGDGALDVLVSTFQNVFGTSSVLRNLGSRTFDSPFQITSAGVNEQVIADLDGDGAMDFAFARATEPSVLIFWGADIDWANHTVGPDTTLSVASAPTGIVAADLDADGDPELAVAGTSSGSVWLNDGTGAFTAGATFATPNATDVAVASADLLQPLVSGGTTDDDGDGFAEIDGDCDDSRATVFPGAAEPCNGRDDDCTGAEDAVGTPESIDGTDEDCDGLVDDGVSLTAEADVRFLGAVSIPSPDSAVAFVGDVDGDGVDDAVLAFESEVTTGLDAGGARLALGGGAGDVDLATSEATILGLGDLHRFGAAVAGLGDPDGDGHGDFVIGSVGPSFGDVYLYPGPVSGALVASDAVAYLDVIETSELGFAVAGGGDLTGDGIADAVLGAPGGDGRVYVVSGDSVGFVNPIGNFTLQGHGAERAGEGVATGDLDGDGILDLLVGAPSHGFPDEVGGVYLVHGPITLAGVDLEWDNDGLVVGVYEGSRTGAEVDVAGDFDGDGLVDAVIGAPSADGGRGAAYVILSSAPFAGTVLDADLVVVGSSATDAPQGRAYQLGAAVAGAGDLDQDGLSEIALGAPGVDDGAGEVLLFLGGTTGRVTRDDAQVSFAGAPGSQAGMSLDGGGDWNADGVPDLLIGGRGSNAGEPTAWLIFGGF